ncbi:HPr kinase/phosphorylase [Frigidibacter sp. MR17.24]|uniref:HPr kinase/phosphorylase n=1 Tax=Frigidibacter sp. MR17.24 TaxID=3127345 RepID=UPI003012A649
MTGATPPAALLHATTVAIEGKGLLILGPSGSGKSALGLWMLAHGARLVADDRTEITATAAALVARCPPAILGRIEARGVGILQARTAGATPVVLAVDLGRPEPERLPPRRILSLLGHDIALVHGQDAPHLGPALLQWLRGGRSD